MLQIRPAFSCYYCYENHSCRQCPLEKKMSPILKKYIGDTMEKYIADNIPCIKCKQQTLVVLGDNSPSLDIVCSNCNINIEVKSKCLSVNILPKDITLPHGNYIKYKNRIKSELDLFIIIYKIDRIKKNVIIREILYAPHTIFQNSNIIKVVKCDNNNSSMIVINDRTQLQKINIDENNILNFQNIIEEYIQKN